MDGGVFSGGLSGLEVLFQVIHPPAHRFSFIVYRLLLRWKRRYLSLLENVLRNDVVRDLHALKETFEVARLLVIQNAADFPNEVIVTPAHFVALPSHNLSRGLYRINPVRFFIELTDYRLGLFGQKFFKLWIKFVLFVEHFVFSAWSVLGFVVRFLCPFAFRGLLCLFTFRGRGFGFFRLRAFNFCDLFALLLYVFVERLLPKRLRS